MNRTSVPCIDLNVAPKCAVRPLSENDTEFYKQFVQNESFKRFVTDMVVNLASDQLA